MVTSRELTRRLANKIADMKMKEKICHVCKKEKKPYTVIVKNDMNKIEVKK